MSRGQQRTQGAPGAEHGAWNAMIDTHFFSISDRGRRITWVDDRAVIARVRPDARLTELKASRDLAARIADLRRLARRYRAMGRELQRPRSLSLAG